MDSKKLQTSTKKSCWTCKDRKVRCDEFFPTCINCTRSRRECIRSSVRLSWPRTNDGRRSMVNDRVPGSGLSRRPSNRTTVFLNTSHWDVTLHMELDRKKISPTHFSAWAFEVPKQPSQISVASIADGETLLSYFSSTMSTHLAPFGGNREIIHLLLKIAFMDETPASIAVLQGILALSSLRLYGSAVAAKFKAKAISMLSSALKEGMDLSEFLRSIAASLLLSSYQIASTSDFSVDWTFFVCGAIKVVKAMSLPRFLDSDEILLLNWLSCHTILSQFSLSHWLQIDSCVYQTPCSRDAQLSAVYSLIPNRSRILGVLGCSLEFLDILSSICTTIIPQTDPSFSSKAYNSRLDALELRLNSLRQYSSAGLSSEESKERLERIAELYRVSGIVYLHRVGRRTRVDFPPTMALVRQAFTILKQLERCEGLWPLFIIGCEARSEEERWRIQDVFTKTLDGRDMGNVRAIKKMVEKAWIQEDLWEEGEGDYGARINALISANQVLPTFI